MAEGFVKKEVIEVDSYDLDKLIIQTYLEDMSPPEYGSVYSTQAAIESSNDVWYVFDGDGSFRWEDDVEILDKWIAGESPKSYGFAYTPHPASFINKLIRDGHLEDGQYLVSVSW